MGTEQSKCHVRDCLVAEGFRIEEIDPTPTEKRADLRAFWNNEEYVIEAKSREESKDWLAFVQQARPGAVTDISRQVRPWNAISSTIEEAHDQLLATPTQREAFRILWMVALHDDDGFVIKCVEKRLLGEVKVVVMKSGHEMPQIKHCFFYAPSDFQRFPDLDAAVLSTRKGGKLCVNTFSHRVEALRGGRLYTLLASHRAVIDPATLEATGKAFLIDKDYCGKPSAQGLWSYLKARYGVSTSVMLENQFNGLLSIPRDE